MVGGRTGMCILPITTAGARRHRLTLGFYLPPTTLGALRQGPWEAADGALRPLASPSPWWTQSKTLGRRHPTRFACRVPGADAVQRDTPIQRQRLACAERRGVDTRGRFIDDAAGVTAQVHRPR